MRFSLSPVGTAVGGVYVCTRVGRDCTGDEKSSFGYVFSPSYHFPHDLSRVFFFLALFSFYLFRTKSTAHAIAARASILLSEPSPTHEYNHKRNTTVAVRRTDTARRRRYWTMINYYVNNM